MRTLTVMATCLALTTAALGGIVVGDHDTGMICLNSSNQKVFEDPMDTGWMAYPQDPEPDWWNAWAYDGEPDPDRWKVIDYEFTATAVEPGFYYVEVALNWSTIDYPRSGPPPDGQPPQPGEEQWIEREVLDTQPVYLAPDTIVDLAEGQFTIWDYNPEWVSADVRIVPDGNPGDIFVQADLWHECVPEPAAMGLMALGGLALLRRRRKR